MVSFLLLPIFTDSFVNSQEWTIARTVPELRLGIVGSLSSGKSTLVHRYLTGEYIQEESPEGGRFKKEVFIENQSHLLLIRDEGGPPEMQVIKGRKWEVNLIRAIEGRAAQQYLQWSERTREDL